MSPYPLGFDDESTDEVEFEIGIPIRCPACGIELVRRENSILEHEAYSQTCSMVGTYNVPTIRLIRAK